jgi:hypothetical protein
MSIKKIKVGIQGKYSIIDSEFFDLVKDMTWGEGGAAKGKPQYVRHQKYNRDTKERSYISLHRYIYESKFGKLKKGQEIDHINGNRFDNRLCNLRACTHQQNSFNYGKKPTRAKIYSKYKGVWYRNEEGRIKRWTAEIKINYKKKYIGTFLTEKEAAIAYNEKATELHGKFAFLNNINN